MSVRASERGLSTMQYVYDAYSLVRFVSDRLNKYEAKAEKDIKYKHLAKAINRALWNAPLFNAQQVYINVQRANAVRIVNKTTAEQRLAFLKNAEENLNLLGTSITTLYDQFRGAIKDKFLIELQKRIEVLQKLIRGVKSSDLRRGT